MVETVGWVRYGFSAFCRDEQEVRKRLRRRKCRVSDWLHRGEGSSILVCEEMAPFSLLGNMGSMTEVTDGRRARVEPG